MVTASTACTAGAAPSARQNSKVLAARMTALMAFPDSLPFAGPFLGALLLLHLGMIMFDDFRAGGLPDAFVLADVFQSSVERIDAMRDTDQVGVERDRHHPAGFFALAVQHVELPADHVAEL